MPDHPIQIVNPNLHVISIHFPIALLFIGTAIELFSFLWRRSSFRAAGRWMILIGALAAIPAATTGMYAARQAMAASDQEWNVLKHTAHLNSEQWDLLMHHIRFNLIGTEVLMVLVIAWLGASDRVRRRGHFAYLIVLLAAVGLLSAGAWHGGEMVYWQSTGTGMIKGGLPPAKEASGGEHADQRVKFLFTGLDFTERQLRRFDEPLDVHASLAGWTIAFAVVTLGLSLRGLWRAPNLTDDEDSASDDDIVNALAGKGEQRSLLASETAPIEPPAPVLVPAARFWLIACVVALSTIWLGWTVAGPVTLKDAIDVFNGENRAKWHIIMATSIVVLTLILALVTRFARHNRLLVGGFSVLLALVLAMQIWLGLLLVFDGSEGPINHFIAPTTQSTVALLLPAPIAA